MLTKDKVCVVIPTGFDGGGTATLGIEYSKLGYDTYFLNNSKGSSCNVGRNSVNTFKDTEELLTIIEKYDRIILGLYYFRKGRADILDLSQIKKVYPEKEVIYIDCYRGNYSIKKRAKDILDKNYDIVWCLSPHIANEYIKLGQKAEVIDFNVYDWRNIEIIESNDLDKKIITVGRVAGVKGSINLLREAKLLSESNLTSDFYYIYEGLDYNVNKNGSVSMMPNLLESLVESKSFSNKKTHDYLMLHGNFNNYDEKLVTNRYNLFPTYNKEEGIQRWKHCKYGLMPYLGAGIHSKLSVYSHPECWDIAPEYCVYELSNAGVPILFSEDYAQRIGYNNSVFVYDKFDNVPNIIYNIERTDKAIYDINRKEQIQFFKDKSKEIREIINSKFLEEI